MDATVRDPRGAGAPISRGAGLAVLGVVLVFVPAELMDRASLVDPIPLPLTVVSAAIVLQQALGSA